MPRVRNQSLADPRTGRVDRLRHLHDECHHAGNARLLSRGRRRRGGRSQHGVGARFRGAPRASRAQPIPCRPEDGTRGSAASSPRRVPPRRKCEAAVAGAAPAGGSLAARCWRTLSGRTSCLACATNPLPTRGRNAWIGCVIFTACATTLEMRGCCRGGGAGGAGSQHRCGYSICATKSSEVRGAQAKAKLR